MMYHLQCLWSIGWEQKTYYVPKLEGMQMAAACRYSEFHDAVSTAGIKQRSMELQMANLKEYYTR